MIEIYSAALLFTLKPHSSLPGFKFFLFTYSSFDSAFFFLPAFVFFSFFRFHFWHFNCCPVQRARSNATISIHLLYTYPSFSHSSNEPSSIHLFKPFAHVLMQNARARARAREKKRVDEECVSIHLFFNRSLCTN